MCPGWLLPLFSFESSHIVPVFSRVRGPLCALAGWLAGWDVMTNLVGSMVDHRYSVAFKSMGNTIVLLVFRLLFVHVNHRRPQKKTGY